MGEIVATKEIEGVTLTVEGVRPEYQDPYYWGFAKFDKKPLHRGGFASVALYVPVHGGITVAEIQDGHWVYGFDCNHAWDDQDLDCLRKAWVLEEAERMALSIIALGTFEKQIVATMEEIWT